MKEVWKLQFQIYIYILRFLFTIWCGCNLSVPLEWVFIFSARQLLEKESTIAVVPVLIGLMNVIFIDNEVSLHSKRDIAYKWLSCSSFLEDIFIAIGMRMRAQRTYYTLQIMTYASISAKKADVFAGPLYNYYVIWWGGSLPGAQYSTIDRIGRRQRKRSFETLAICRMSGNRCYWSNVKAVASACRNLH